MYASPVAYGRQSDMNIAVYSGLEKKRKKVVLYMVNLSEDSVSRLSELNGDGNETSLPRPLILEIGTNNLEFILLFS